MVGIAVAAVAGIAAADQLFAMDPSFDAAGDPVPSVGAYPDGAASAIRYRRCLPGRRSCARMVRFVDREPTPGPTPAGTVFSATARWDGHAYASSARWHGRVRAASRPVLTGETRVGARVTVRPARWVGGWSTDQNLLAIEACRTSSATGCVMLSGLWLECSQLGCGVEGGPVGPLVSRRSVRVGYALSGWYLFGLDARISPRPDGLVGFSRPQALPVWRTSPTLVRSAPYGPIVGPPGPHVRILPVAQEHGDHLLVASVRCAVSCHVWITVSLLSRNAKIGRRATWSANTKLTGTAEVGVSGSIPAGPLTVSINVGDGPYINGHTRSL